MSLSTTLLRIISIFGHRSGQKHYISFFLWKSIYLNPYFFLLVCRYYVFVKGLWFLVGWKFTWEHLNTSSYHVFFLTRNPCMCSSWTHLYMTALLNYIFLWRKMEVIMAGLIRSQNKMFIMQLTIVIWKINLYRPWLIYWYRQRSISSYVENLVLTQVTVTNSSYSLQPAP